MQSCTVSLSSVPSSSSSTLLNRSLDIVCPTIFFFFNSSIKLKPRKLQKLTTHFTNSSPPLFSRHSFVLSASAAASAFDSDIDDGAVESNQDSEEEFEDESDVKEEKADSAVAEQCRLYVGNLPYSMTSSQLSDLFAEAGRVITVEIIYDKVTDRSRGFAFVTMASTEEANAAIQKFEGFEAGGRSMKVNFPEVPKGGEREVIDPMIKSTNQGFIDTPHKIYAGNLSWNLTSQGLIDVFSNQPGFLSAKVIYQRGSGRSRGFGFVTFGTAEEVESALNAMNGVEVEGRPIRLNLAEQKAPPVVESSSENKLESDEVLSSVGI